MNISKYFIIENYRRRITRFYHTKLSEKSFLVAGLGRCGTTFLTETLIDYGLHYEMIFLESLSERINFRPGYIYKTHDYPPSSLPDNLKVIYLFRNPMNIAISAYIKINEWGRAHHKHFHSDLFVPNDSILKKDTLLLEKQFDAWIQPQNFSFISIKYEALFKKNTIDTLNEFLGIKVKFKNPKPSRTNYKEHPLCNQIYSTYSKLADKVDIAPDCKVWQ